MASAFNLAFERFNRDERGGVAIIFALTIVVLLLICGLGIDYGRAIHAKAKLSAAIDAATLAAAKGIRLQNLTSDQAKALAKTMFLQNFQSGSMGFADINAINIAVDTGAAKVDVQVDASVPTTLGQLAGIKKFDIPSQSAAIFEAKDIEVAVQLDVTGSMGGQKIRDLKTATKNLVDTLIPASGTGAQKVRIGFAPFSAGVNAGSYAKLLSGAAASNTCVYERRSLSYQDSDDYPSGYAALKTKLDLPLASNCPSAKVLPLTSDRALLKSTVDGYSMGGTTAGHLGTAFAWYLLSPNWATVWPSDARPVSYTDKDTIKVAILMTDGEYNTVGGSSSSRSARYAKETCTAMKAKGITVYTVGFRLSHGTQAEATMQACASSLGHAYLAANGAALNAAFADIAQNITQLRLSR